MKFSKQNPTYSNKTLIKVNSKLSKFKAKFQIPPQTPNFTQYSKNLTNIKPLIFSNPFPHLTSPNSKIIIQ